MSVLVVGMSHRVAPVTVLERVSMDPEKRDRTATRLVNCPSLSEVILLSTCNRVEVYSVTISFHSGVNEIVECLADVSGLDAEELREHLYVRYADAAAEHMLAVASGLDSMVLGEQQIIGQVRTAYQAASENGTVGPTLHALAQAALHTGKRVHTETGIDATGASMVTFALDQVAETLHSESFEGHRALVLGAGAMSSLAATHLGKRGIDELVIANRTFDRAQRLAQHSREAGVPAHAVEFNERQKTYGDVDIIVSATGAHDYTVKAPDITTNSPVFVDLSMPRDIDPEVPGTLINIESLKQSEREESKEVEEIAKRIIREELDAFSSAQRVRDVAPALSALRSMAAGIVKKEMERFDNRVDTDPEVHSEVAKTVQRVVDKLLHQPTVQVKALAANSGTISYDNALQQLFGLQPPSVSTQAAKLPTSATMNKAIKENK
ncbi:MAG: glutamyl-tRNA reductase [Corynebacterium pyruviciproducens]|uniref:glutamyl-tRNA reductase n=1 Tax=Corynebacterium pyruviciproducens TaxID=598660 RepID=UPI00245708D2|nr:glutamyl-tRNA reductase [Corynebacterium pyruviciproducens]MDH4657413.1 glutamyl-tRNA reductase [Corynebacterium pyruviciproducens]MDK6566113.1 glutamyl-tRNA reductase [Corynebacterium pyruviciproducens]